MSTSGEEEEQKRRMDAWREIEPLAREISIRPATENRGHTPEAIADAAWKIAAAHYRRLCKWIKTGE